MRLPFVIICLRLPRTMCCNDLHPLSHTRARIACLFELSQGCSEAVSLLAKAGADLDRARLDIGWTPLHAAAAGGYSKTITTLLQLGAKSVNTKTEGGETPFLVAAEEGHMDVCLVLAAFGYEAYFPFF